VIYGLSDSVVTDCNGALQIDLLTYCLSINTARGLRERLRFILPAVALLQTVDFADFRTSRGSPQEMHPAVYIGLCDVGKIRNTVGVERPLSPDTKMIEGDNN